MTSFLRLDPPFSLLVALAVLGFFVIFALVLLVLRLILGPPNAVAKRWTLWGIRAAIVLAVIAILFNPVRVAHLPGPVQRPQFFYLLDTSASMQMGNPRSRWDETLAIVREAQERANKSPAEVKAFRFGQRLAAIEDLSQLGLAAPTSGSPEPVAASVKRVAPTDADTRLLTALRQISSRFGRVPPQGIVIFSDGRSHDEVGLEQLAAEFARLKVPLYVVPVGDTTKGGDLAVSAVVAPPRVRKYSEVEVQVFLRSFGYDGKRSEVQLFEITEGNRPGRKLASLPITLQSGFQSVSLSFRTDLATKKLRVAIPAMPNEVSDRNNHVDTEMAIDRTKIRVLYVEGSGQPTSQVRVGDRTQIRGPFTDLKQALTDDEDIECVVLAAPAGTGKFVRITEVAQADGVRGFPSTVAELSAFDAIILSNVSSEAFTEKQLEWIDQWIGQRGGGLCMIGGEYAFASGGWNDTPLAAMLPVEMLPGGLDWVPGEPVRIAPELPPSPHSLWNLVADEKQNRQIAGSMPLVTGVNRWAGARPNLTTVLATTSISGTPASAAVDEGSLLSVGALTSALRGFTTQKPGVEAGAKSAADVPAIVAGRYGRGRTIALAFPVTAPYADELVQKWGSGDNRYYGKFCRNLVYWLTESSAIGRRRLVASADKRFYRPGDTITLTAHTYDESASPTRNYRVVAMVEPHATPGEAEPDASPLRWPGGLARTSGEEGPFIAWGEEFELALGGQEKPVRSIALPLAEVLASGASSQSLRLELTAYEDLTQVDSTSLDIQVLHDPFEQQNPFPNHDLLARLAAGSGGKTLRTAEELADLLEDVPLSVGPPVVKKSPLWSNAWVLMLLVGLFTVEWCWRRSLGLA